MLGISKFLVTASGCAASMKIAPLLNGSFMIFWTKVGGAGEKYLDVRDHLNVSTKRLFKGNIVELYAQKYDATGMPSGFAFKCSVHSTVYNRLSILMPPISIIPLIDANFLVSWNGHAQKYSADGTAIGNEFNSSMKDQICQDVAYLLNGSFVFAFTDARFGSVSFQIKRYDVDGTFIQSKDSYYFSGANGKESMAVASLMNGGFLVAWLAMLGDRSGCEIYAQRYDANGAPIEPGVLLPVPESKVAALTKELQRAEEALVSMKSLEEKSKKEAMDALALKTSSCNTAQKNAETEWSFFSKIAFTAAAVFIPFLIYKCYRTLGNPTIVENFGAVGPAAFAGGIAANVMPGVENMKITHSRVVDNFESGSHDADITASREISGYTPLEWLLAETACDMQPALSFAINYL